MTVLVYKRQMKRRNKSLKSMRDSDHSDIIVVLLNLSTQTQSGKFELRIQRFTTAKNEGYFCFNTVYFSCRRVNFFRIRKPNVHINLCFFFFCYRIVINTHNVIIPPEYSSEVDYTKITVALV